jgi:ABC-type enterobactin transport system permease subunit
MPSTGSVLAREELSSEERILLAIANLTDEVLSIRRTLDPITRRQRIFIIALSAFVGGVLTNLALWLLGFGTMYGLLQRGHP